MTSTLSVLKVDLQHYHEVLLGLVRTTSKTTQLVRSLLSYIYSSFVTDLLELSAILATRANDSLRAIMATIQTGIAELQLQSRKTGLDTASLLKITTQGHKDGFIIKVLTQIATVFLPASLVAVSVFLRISRD
jgi:Mg2+ and Co2+ transporter CorA